MYSNFRTKCEGKTSHLYGSILLKYILHKKCVRRWTSDLRIGFSGGLLIPFGEFLD
jgi:hypothetical protein